MRILSTGLLVLACVVTTALGQAQFKQLAGEASEINSMRLPSPQTLAVSSKSAVVPITQNVVEIPVENAENFKLILLAPNSKGWRVEAALLAEDSFVDLRNGYFADGVTLSETNYGFDGKQLPAEVFEFAAVKTGSLRLRIDAAELSANSGKAIGYIVASSDSPYLLRSHVDTFETVVGQEIGLVASLVDKGENQLFGNIREARISIRSPKGETFELPMNSDLNGTFRGSLRLWKTGEYLAQITATGSTPEGAEFVRTTEQIIYVGKPAALGSNARVKLADDARFEVSIPVSGLKAGQKVIAHAEVWGRDADGSEVPINWIGGMTNVTRNSRISISLDARWLARANVKDGLQLRNVRIQDPDYFVALGTAESIALPSLDLPKSTADFNGEITDEMRMGKRPETQTTDAVGGKLMLVHGYCSGANPWSPAQFADSIQFLDPNANRSHDQFAQRIANFGASYPSFGVVAHSQGGAASLHLYTYYWSGLDNAIGARLIQSVGTPYQGTSLAGNLALIGSIFGAGCGSNYDLTYNGAAAWLAGIPSWARTKVFYHTTSFTDLWWRYDYCNIASDVVLSDPDDGVIERARGQLSGANNLGHKTGWCHTSGMRDPAQTSDTARNANMNANAAR